MARAGARGPALNYRRREIWDASTTYEWGDDDEPPHALYAEATGNASIQMDGESAVAVQTLIAGYHPISILSITSASASFTSSAGSRLIFLWVN